MKVPDRVLTRDIVFTLLRIFLGFIFIFASLEKILHPDAFATSIIDYRIVSAGPALLIATVLPWIELLCGLGLLFGVFLRGSALLALIMLSVFTVLVLSALWRGLDISCGCFTQDPTAERIGWKKVGEDLLLTFMSILAFRTLSIGFSLERFLQNRSRGTSSTPDVSTAVDPVTSDTSGRLAERRIPNLAKVSPGIYQR
jgi:putative oxidoreductase